MTTTPVKTRVLVIDDEPQILRALRINLSVRGYEVLTAATGTEALKLAAERRPDVIVLDLGLPDMSGIEAALNRLARDLAEGRDEMVAELRSDLLVLTRAVRAARFNDPFRDDLLRDPLVLRDRS